MHINPSVWGHTNCKVMMVNPNDGNEQVAHRIS
jgi:hypothetical protein